MELETMVLVVKLFGAAVGVVLFFYAVEWLLGKGETKD